MPREIPIAVPLGPEPSPVPEVESPVVPEGRFPEAVPVPVLLPPVVAGLGLAVGGVPVGLLLSGLRGDVVPGATGPV